MDIDGRRVAVTGATSGIGKATAEAMAARGGHVLLLARTGSDLDDVAGSIRESGGRADTFPVDLADREDVETTAERIESEVGVPEILVNNAGIGSYVSVPESESGQSERIMAVPYFGAFNLVRAFLPTMLERDEGHVVNVGSPAAYTPIAGATAYNASRFAFHGFNEALWLDTHSTGLGVTEVVPFTVEGSGYFEHNENVRERIPGTARFIRSVTTEDVASAIVKGVRKERRRVVLPLELRLTLAFGRLFPGIMSRLNARTGWQPSPSDWNGDDEAPTDRRADGGMSGDHGDEHSGADPQD